jgi:ribosomal protein S18 acetylase RimI-like enzyme
MRERIRPYAGDADFELMRRIVTASWQRAAPVVSCTVGDLEWWRVNDPDQPLEGHASIWELDGQPVGWEWLDPPFTGDWHLAPGVAAAPFLEPFLDRIEAAARAAPPEPPVPAPVAGEPAAPGAEPAAPGAEPAPPAGAPPPRMTRAWAMDADGPAIEMLTARGYGPDGLALSHWVLTMPNAGGEPLADDALPAGYRHEAMRWPDDLDRRVDVHRAAFAPSKMTTAKYGLIQALPHYGPERDRVVVAADGNFAAFTVGWWDPDGHVGELEPVGTHPDHRRRGLGRAVCLRALAELDRLGARHVVINTGRNNLAAEALYEGLGCVRVTTSRRYARPLAD